jgi:ABC-type multidrug transport system fused ATPase/permease subunit
VNLIQQIWREYSTYRRPFLSLAAVILLLQVAKLSVMYFFGVLVEGFRTEDVYWLYLHSAYVFGAAVLTVCLTTWSKVIFYGKIGYPIERTMALAALRKLKRLSIGQLITQDISIIYDRVRKGQQAVRDTIETTAITQFLPIAFNLVIIVPALFIKHWVLGAIGLVGFSLYMRQCCKVNKKIWLANRRHVRRGEKLEAHNFEVVRLFKFVKTSNQEERTIAEFDKGFKAYSDEGARLWNGHLIRMLVSAEFAALACLGGLLLASVWLWSRNGISMMEFVVAITWSINMFSTMSIVSSMQRNYVQNKSFIGKYFKFLNMVEDRVAWKRTEKGFDLDGDIVFEGVGYRYPLAPKDILYHLRNVSFCVRKGMRVAIVGLSGSGKSTLVDLLRGCLYPDQGRILINGHDTRLIPPEELFKAICFMPQTPEFFNNTVKYNLTYGLNGEAESLSDDALLEFAKTVNLDVVLADRLNHDVGENGIKLSGGERQRLALGRAILPKPLILILDEPTSALDPVNDALVKIAIDNAAKGRTCLVIAHKLDTARHADMVIVVNEGEVVGIGKHDDLMKTCDAYEMLVAHEQKPIHDQMGGG